MDQAFNAVFELYKATIVGHGYNLASNNSAGGVTQVDLGPWVGTNLLATQADTLRLGVKLEHLDLNLLANLNHLRRMGDATVGHIGDVKQAVDTAQVDEGAVIGDVFDHTDHNGVDLEILEGLGPLDLAVLFEEDAPAEHDVSTALVEFDNLELEGQAQHFLEVLDGAKVDL